MTTPAVRVNGSAAASETAADARGEPGGIRYAVPVAKLRGAANEITVTSADGGPVRACGPTPSCFRPSAEKKGSGLNGTK